MMQTQSRCPTVICMMTSVEWESRERKSKSRLQLLEREESTFDEDSVKISILIELVGGQNLTHDPHLHDQPIHQDQQPFCVVSFGGCRIHSTRPASSLNPVWTVDTDSLFVLKATTQELAQHSLTIEMWTNHSNSILSSEQIFLGQVSLSYDEIKLHCDGERFEKEVKDELGEETGLRGTLALRMRMASASDLRFVKLWNKRKLETKLEAAAVKTLIEDEEVSTRPFGRLITEQDERQVAGESFMKALSSSFMSVSSTSFTQQATGPAKVRVKPNCDPRRPKETACMTPHDLALENRKPSRSWVQAGSGTLGKLYLEVLSCHGLPNVDVGEAVGNVTDPFVAAVFEDTMVQTPVIDDELSPLWPPWVQRAFCFGILHPASMLYLAVFDFDLGPLADHEPIGRVAVNISNLHRDTQYVLKYNLYPSSNVTDRTSCGTITIRLRIEIFDEKKAMMAALRPRPRTHVNVRYKKSFKVVRYTCFGQHDNEEKFDLQVTRSYINEIFEYKQMFGYTIVDSFGSLIFWRGQVSVFSVLIPLYSFLFFCCATTLVEKPQLAPAFFLISLGGVMFANQMHRMQHPSPWYRCPSFFHYLSILIRGRSETVLERIDAGEGAEETEHHEKAWAKRIALDRKAAEKKAEMQKELKEVGCDKIQTEVSNMIPLDLLEKLGRWQGYIGVVCRYLRFVKIIVTWEESVVSFWITFVLLGAGILALILPWSFILTWIGRIVVYGFFGPHMKIVDLYFRANSKDKLKNIVDKMKSRHQAARIRREDALKLKAIKCLRFGPYITQVPAFNLSRHYDRPLPASSARYVRKSPPVPKDCAWIPGQQLYGVMIPRPEKASVLNEEESKVAHETFVSLDSHMTALKAAIKLGGMQKRNRLLRLKSRHELQDEPEAVGYELVQWGGKSLEELVPTQMEWQTSQLSQDSVGFENMNLCLVPYSNNKLQKKEMDMLCIKETKSQTDEQESDETTSLLSFDGGQSSFREITQNEEGIEIVAWGRFNASSSELVVDDRKRDVEVVAPSPKKDDSRLSILYKDSDSTFVAFYRPS